MALELEVTVSAELVGESVTSDVVLPSSAVVVEVSALEVVDGESEDVGSSAPLALEL